MKRLLILALLLATSSRADEGPGPEPVSVRIDTRRPLGRISPLLYGQFLEFMFEGIKGGLHAELLRDRSFEEAPSILGLPRHWERYPDDRNDDYALTFTREATTARTPSGGHSLRIQVDRGALSRHGLFQPRVPVRAGVDHQATFWARSADFKGRIVVALEPDVQGGPPYDEEAVEGIGPEWKRFAVTLRPNRDDPLARFALLPEGQGTIEIDQASLMPGDAVGGVRRDVLERIREVRPAFIRWPGGNVAQDYHWRTGVGPRDGRPIWTNRAWRNEPEPSDFGTDEFVAMCRWVGAEPSITVNVEGDGATVEEAAAWVEYCNGPATSTYGAIRAANGHPEPYDVLLWELGNEIWGDWVRGHSDAETYAENVRRYAQAMRAVDPRIRLIAAGDNNMVWNRKVLELAGSEFDDLAIHHYYGLDEMAGDARNLMARPLHYQRFYRELGDAIRELVPGRPIHLAINEWGLSLPIERHHSIEAALFAARFLNVLERSSDLVAMSAVSDLVNGWPGGIIQAGRHDVFVTPTYLVNQLYAETAGAVRLGVEVVGPSFDTSREGKGVPVVDAVASLSEDRKRLYLKLVNTDPERPMKAVIQVEGAAVAGTAELGLIRSPDRAAFNSFASPDAIRLERSELPTGASFTVDLPAASVSALTLSVEIPPAQER